MSLIVGGPRSFSGSDFVVGRAGPIGVAATSDAESSRNVREGSNGKATRLDQIHKRIERIKAELVTIDEMRPGSLTEQLRKPDDQRGYYQLSYTHGGRGRTEYVSRDFVRDVRRQIVNYKRFKVLTTEWIDLSIEQSRLKMKPGSES
jgi:hypothetical protein